MLPVRAFLVDFDGTACPQDVSEMLLDAIGEPEWERFDDAVDRGEMGLREAAELQAAMLRGSGALYSDVVFAKDALVQICEQDGVPFLPWDTFDDVRNAFETLGSLPWAAEPDPWPGWTTP